VKKTALALGVLFFAADAQAGDKPPAYGLPAGTAGARPPPEVQVPEHQHILGRALAAMRDEDVDGARALLEPLLASRPADLTVTLAAGILRFHEQRYADAVALLEKGEGAAPELAREYLDLARKALDLTRSHARFEGEHFAVSHPKGKDEVLVPYLLEALEAQRAALGKDLGYAPPGKVTVEIVETTRALAQLSTLTEEEIKTSGTIAICKFNKLMVVSPKALLHGYDWIDTAAHEYVHYVVTRRTRNNTPIWLHEGIAKYEETRWRGRGGEAFSPYAAALLKDAAKRDRLITFAEMHPSMAKLPSQEAAALAFAEVVVAVEYLEKKGGAPLLNRILDLVRDGRSAEEAVAQALGQPFAAFMADWKRYLLSRPLPEGGETELRRLRFKGDPKHGGTWSEWSEISDEKARGHARLGEIFRTRGRWDAARMEYAKAVKRVGTRSAVLADHYATAAMMAGRDDDAASALAEAAGRHPEYAALHVHLGRLYLKQKKWSQATESLLRANRIDPFDPEIHAGLALAYDALGEPGAASREQRFAGILTGEK
jgi:tetratricopeptide (TPR) repeat protein